MPQTLLQVQRQIEKLRETEAKLKKLEAAGVIARMKEAIDAYGFTAGDLFGVGSKSASAKKSKPSVSPKASKAKSSQKARYADGAGNEWVGRGPRPAWLRDALASGKALSDFAISGAKSKASTPKKAKRKQVISVKYRDGNGNTWNGRGWKPLWLKSQIESGRKIEEFSV